MPRLLRDLVKGILASADGVTVVGELDGPERVVEVARSTNADVVVCASDGGQPLVTPDLLAECPRARIVAIDGDGTGGVLWELRPSRRELGAISAPALVGAVRGEAPT